MKEQKDGVQVIKIGAWSAGPGCHGRCEVKLFVKDGKQRTEDPNLRVVQRRARWALNDYESVGREFESLRAHHSNQYF